MASVSRLREKFTTYMFLGRLLGSVQHPADDDIGWKTNA